MIKFLYVLGLSIMISVFITQSYAAPVNGPTATIVRNLKYGVSFSYFKDSQNCQGESALLAGYAFGKKAAEVPANRKVTLAANYDDGSMSCDRVVFSFVPKPGQKYRVSYGFDYQHSSDGCKLTVSNLTTNRNVPFELRHFKAGFFSGGRCVD